MFKPWMLGIGAAIAMALSGAGQASDGKISVVGAVTTPTCTLIVSSVGVPLIGNGISNQVGTTLNVHSATGALFGKSAADCDAAVDTANMAAATLVSIYFESLDSVEREPGGIISIVYK